MSNAQIRAVVALPGEEPEIREIEESRASYRDIVEGWLVRITWDAPFVMFANAEPRRGDLLFNRLLIMEGGRRNVLVGTILVLGEAADGEPRGLSAGEAEEALRLVREMPAPLPWVILYTPEKDEKARPRKPRKASRKRRR